MAPTQAGTAQDLTTLPQYDGFPYLTIRVVPALYHITLLPAGAAESTLLNIARMQTEANRLDVCLVLAADRGVYLLADGQVRPSSDTPRGGTLIAEMLHPPLDFLATPELEHRKAQLAELVDVGRRSGRLVLGNLSKGGRKATPVELRRLRGADADGVPSGLRQCPACGDWRGACLDTNPEFAEFLMPVHCRCANHNRCARCGETLHRRRLNANFYDPHDRRIWRVPGFCGLGHRCA